MWTYEKKLQYPVKIKNPDPAAARVIITQLGGPDGETGASMRYLHQRYSCPYPKVTGVLTDVGTGVSEMFHLEQSSKKPCSTRLLIHSIKTANKIKKYDGNIDISTNVTDGKTERVINLFMV